MRLFFETHGKLLGHHAEDDRAMGFCFFNNVAVAVASMLEKHPDTVKKVLIIDWYVILSDIRRKISSLLFFGVAQGHTVITGAMGGFVCMCA